VSKFFSNKIISSLLMRAFLFPFILLNLRNSFCFDLFFDSTAQGIDSDGTEANPFQELNITYFLNIHEEINLIINNSLIISQECAFEFDGMILNFRFLLQLILYI